MSFLRGLLVSGLAGSALFVALLALRPLTARLFSKTWHYYSLIVPIAFMLGGGAALGRLNLPGAGASPEAGAAAAGAPAMPAMPAMPAPPAAPAEPGISQSREAASQAVESPAAEPVENGQGRTLARLSGEIGGFAQARHKYLLAAWGAGFLAFACICWRRYAKFRRQALAGGERLADARCPIPVVVSDAAQGPMLLGALRPVIVLPRAAYTEEELGIVLAHEMLHYRRKDLSYKMLALFAQAAHWYNPLVVLLARQLNYFCELSVDERMAANMDGAGRKLYGEIILQALAKCPPGRGAAHLPATRLGCSKNELKRRLTSMKNAKKMRKPALALATLVTTAMVAGGLFVSQLLGVSAVAEGAFAPAAETGADAQARYDEDFGTDFSILTPLHPYAGPATSFHPQNSAPDAPHAPLQAGGSSERRQSASLDELRALVFDEPRVRELRFDSGDFVRGFEISAEISHVLFTQGEQAELVVRLPEWLDGQYAVETDRGRVSVRSAIPWFVERIPPGGFASSRLSSSMAAGGMFMRACWILDVLDERGAVWPMTIEVSLPAGIAPEIFANSMATSITFEGVRGTFVSANAMNGRVSVTGGEFGTLSANAMNGTVSVTGGEFETLDARAQNGSVYLELARGVENYSITVSAIGGRATLGGEAIAPFELARPGAGTEVSLGALSGRIEITCPLGSVGSGDASGAADAGIDAERNRQILDWLNTVTASGDTENDWPVIGAHGTYTAAGFVVNEVLPGFGAMDAGIRVGDVLLTIDGLPASGAHGLPGRFAQLVGGASAGRVSVIELDRGGHIMSVEVEFRPWPYTVTASGDTENDWPVIGVHGTYTAAGFVVNEVLPGFGAMDAGIRVGDVLLTIDGLPAGGADGLPGRFAQLVGGASAGRVSVIELDRGGHIMSVEVEFRPWP